MLLEVAVIGVALFAYVYFSVTKNYNHWTKLGVRQVEPSFPFGTFGEDIIPKKHGLLRSREEYERFSDVPFYGVYFIAKPRIVVKDIELVKHIFIKDFEHFGDRFPNGQTDGRSNRDVDQVWAKQMFNVTGDDWRTIRTTFTPIFTSGKLKGMMPIVSKILDQLVDEIGAYADAGEMFNCKESFGKMTMDAIASCAFGVDAQSFTNKESKFVEYARNIFKRKPRDIIAGIAFAVPYGRLILGKLGIPLFKPTETRFFIRSIKETIRYRAEHPGEKRNDMLDLMVECLHGEKIADEDEKDLHESDQFESDSKLNFRPPSKALAAKKEFDELLVVATALVMTIAGYDTTANALSYSCYYLAKHPDIQRRLQQEVDEAYAESGGRPLTYTAIQGLTYTDMVVHEALRMHPPLAYLQRSCLKDYKMPGTDVTVKQGDLIYINVAGIHYDEKIYPNPNEFNPENFSKENKAKRSPMSFLSFGQGPRACIGMRFALLEAKMTLAAVAHKFNFVTCEKTVEKIVPDPSQILGHNKEGLYVRAERR